jgi:hypothetical protein
MTLYLMGKYIDGRLRELVIHFTRGRHAFETIAS